MNPKSLLILGASTVVVAIVAAMTLHSRESAVRGSDQQGKLFPDLMASINDVTSITIKNKDGEYRLERANDRWSLADKHNYPVDIEPVRKTLIGMADLAVVEPKTSDASRYSKLGVEEPDAEGATSTLVTLKNGEGREVAKLLVGKKHEAKAGAAVSQLVYVRKAGDPQSYLAKGELDLREKSTDWLQKEILKLTRDRVQSVEVTHPDGAVVHVERATPEQKDFTLRDVPEGKELKYPSIATSMSSALEYLNLEDVVPAGDVNFEESPGAVCRFKTFDGMTVVVRTKDADEKTYAHFEVSFEAPPETPTAETPASDATDPTEGSEGDAAKPADAKAADAKAAAAKHEPEEVKKEVEELNARLSSWTFVIPAYNRTTFAKQMSDMVKDKAPPMPPAGEGDEEGEDAPMLIPGDLPPEIQEQIRKHQESLGNKTIVEPPKPAEGTPPAGGAGGTPPPGEPPPPPPPQDG